MTLRMMPDAMESLEELRRIRGTKTIARLMRAPIDEEVARVDLGGSRRGDRLQVGRRIRANEVGVGAAEPIESLGVADYTGRRSA